MCNDQINSLSRCKPLLGTFVDISLFGDVSDNALISFSNTVFQEIERIQQMMSFHDPKSELSLLNAAMLLTTNTPIEISADLYFVLSLALELNTCSDGYYDIAIAPNLVSNTVLPDHLSITPMFKKNTLSESFFGTSKNIILYETHSNLVTKSKKYITNTKPICIDLGGIAKGYAVDCAIEKIPLTIQYIINAGGDLSMSHWQKKHIALKYGKRTSAIKKVMMLNKSAASSGLYHQEGSSHIVNPNKLNAWNQPSKHTFKGVVTVFAKSTMLADALTKLVILMPNQKVMTVLKHFQAKAIIVNRFGFKRTVSP